MRLILSTFTANFTRFYVIARSADWQLPSDLTSFSPWSYPSSQNKGLLRIRTPETCEPSPGFINTRLQAGNGTRGGGLASLLSALDLSICRLDRRPVLGAKTFSHLYIVEVDGGEQLFDSAGSSPIDSDAAMGVEDSERWDGGATDLELWALRLREAAGRVVEAGGDAEILGCW